MQADLQPFVVGYFCGVSYVPFLTKTAKIENFAGLIAFEGSSRDALRALRWGS
jgi:hypothetical protein